MGGARACPSAEAFSGFSTKSPPLSGSPPLVWYNSPHNIPDPYKFSKPKSFCMFFRKFCASRQKLQDCNPRFKPKTGQKPSKMHPFAPTQQHIYKLQVIKLHFRMNFQLCDGLFSLDGGQKPLYIIKNKKEINPRVKNRGQGCLWPPSAGGGEREEPPYGRTPPAGKPP